MKTEKKQMSKKTMGVIAGISAVLIVLVIFACVRMNREFEADQYVSTILDYTFKGDAKNADGMFDAASLTQLENQYEAQITAFVDKSITGGVEMEAEMEEKYVALCKDIFKSMKYKVQSTDKVNEDEYKVTVEYQASDVFQKYMATSNAEYQRIMEKVNKGEYRGTKEEIDIQMRTEAIHSYYEILNTAYQEVQYGDKESMVFSVKRGENDMFAMDSEKVNEFIKKIVGLDEKQD